MMVWAVTGEVCKRNVSGLRLPTMVRFTGSAICVPHRNSTVNSLPSFADTYVSKSWTTNFLLVTYGSLVTPEDMDVMSISEPPTADTETDVTFSE